MLYETIFKRRSVRSYDMSALEAETLDDIKNAIDTAQNLTGQTFKYKIMTAEETGQSKAPYYIVADYSGTDESLMNVGFVLEYADLYIQSKGLGSLYLGMAKPNGRSDNYAIMLAFGKTSVSQRNGENDFDRLVLSEVSDCDCMASRAARLAPSAMNSQPWKISVKPGLAAVSYVGRGLARAILKKKLSKIDIGIATRCLLLGLQEKGKNVTEVRGIAKDGSFKTEIVFDV